jgi:Niemann-Pick C1 protein
MFIRPCSSAQQIKQGSGGRDSEECCAGGHLCCSGEQAGIMHQQLRRAEPFIIGCPACLNNFRNIFCSLFCSPDQATFTNVTAVQQASRKESRDTQVTAVAEVSFYLSEGFKNDTFSSCKDVIFGAANSRAMTYIGNNAQKAQV